MQVSIADRELLKKLPYSSYLRTKFWQEVRKLALVRSGGACQLCASKSGLQVHHRTYTSRGYEDQNLSDLTVLCKACHAKFHRKRKPKKRTTKKNLNF
jgi:5-methylcytosine-specific restriction endonuclease McrA